MTARRDNIVQQQIVQQRQGLDSNGKPFINANTGTDEYSPSTAKKKGRKKPIDLHDKGDFQQEIFIDVRTDTFILDSADSKTDKLIKQFGGDIFGLNPESKAITKPAIQKELASQLKKQIREA